MKIYYAIFYPLLHFLFAIGLSILIITAYSMVGRIPEWFESLFIAILILRGFLFIRIPYFELNDSELIIYNRFGGRQKSYPFQELSDFHFENNKLYLKRRKKSKIVRVSKIFVPPKKWDEFVAYIKQGDLTKELH